MPSLPYSMPTRHLNSAVCMQKTYSQRKECKHEDKPKETDWTLIQAVVNDNYRYTKKYKKRPLTEKEQREQQLKTTMLRLSIQGNEIQHGNTVIMRNDTGYSVYSIKNKRRGGLQ